MKLKPCFYDTGCDARSMLSVLYKGVWTHGAAWLFPCISSLWEHPWHPSSTLWKTTAAGLNTEHIISSHVQKRRYTCHIWKELWHNFDLIVLKSEIQQTEVTTRALICLLIFPKRVHVGLLITMLLHRDPDCFRFSQNTLKNICDIFNMYLLYQ